MKRLSVIIPGYNTPERWWRRCTTSVLKAIGQDDEVVCIDDGSVIPVESSWVGAGTDSRVRIIRQENRGLASARNAGLRVLSGEYVTFVDSDDEVTPEAFSRSLELLKRFRADIAVYGVRVVWPDDGLHKTDACQEDVYAGELAPSDVGDLHRRCLLNYACNKIYRRGFLDANGIVFNPAGMPCEDIIFNISCIRAGAKFCVSSHVGYIYYRTRSTLLSRYKATSFEGTRLASAIWREYKDSTPGAREVLGDFGETSSLQESMAEWRNIWMPGTPFSLRDRWKWLKEHPELGGVKAFFKMMLWTFVRRHFYFRFVRRWHTKRLFDNVCEWNDDDRSIQERPLRNEN